ncbi:MAG: NAD(+) synthase [Cytophagales bacterium]|nr:NAD(+) synthase [Cytophagales bacterium]MDW8384274.1 NAD(+) synthase [Flammeovirgaceae bacterium]
MKILKVAGASLNQTPLDWENNRRNIIEAIRQAKKNQVNVLCLPELCICGYGCEDMFLSYSTAETAWYILQTILPETTQITVNVGLPIWHYNRVYNTAALLADGKIVGFVAKQFLANNGIHYETRWFTAWQAGKATEIERDGKRYPFGDVIFEVNQLKIGFEICEDAWAAERPGRNLYKSGIDIVLNPSASHFSFEKLETRKRFVVDGSRQFGCTYIYANLVGNEAGRAIYDGGVIIAQNGKLLCVSERFTYHNVHLTKADISISTQHQQQAQMSGIFQPDLRNYPALVKISFLENYPEKISPPILKEKSWEASPYLKEEEFARAIALALFDYMRKTRSHGFVLSLSGGADSSSLAIAVRLMIYLAIEQLGLEKFKEKLKYIADLQRCQTQEEICSVLLAVAYQPTENSSETTQKAAQSLAQSIGATFYQFDINPIFKAYVQTIENALGRPLSWQQDDIALQNIQARVRAPSIWLLANLRKALLLATSNRSEAAVGYATMDGDTSGGLSPLAGIDKPFIQRWLLWLEQVGLEGELRFPVLRLVNEQKPTAELRPLSYQQTDEDDLMPYSVLNQLEAYAIRDKYSPSDCLRCLQSDFPQYSSTKLKEWTIRFFELWARNQWKRERYAPSFHFDDRNLDPRSWCRFPILSGGFEYELKSLKVPIN